MKRILVVFLVIGFSLTGCIGNDDSFDLNIPERITGSWTVTQVFDSDGNSDPVWRDAVAIEIFSYEFNSVGNVITDKFVSSCNQGTFQIQNTSLISFTFPCAQFTRLIESVGPDELILDFQENEPMKLRFAKDD